MIEVMPLPAAVAAPREAICATPRALRMAVIAAIARQHDVTVAEIMSDRRDRHVVHARRAAMTAIYRQFPDSLPQIGRLFRRDHSTVMHNLRAAGSLGRRNRHAG